MTHRIGYIFNTFITYSLQHKRGTPSAQAFAWTSATGNLGLSCGNLAGRWLPLCKPLTQAWNLHFVMLMRSKCGGTGPSENLTWTQNDGQQKNANTWLISTKKTTKKQEGCLSGSYSVSSSPLWNALGAKPKNKSFPWEMGGRVIARAKHPEICDATGWPALPSRQSAWSTPELSRTQPWIAAKGRTSNKPPQQPSVQLENRFTLLLQDPKLLKYQIFLLRTQLWKTALHLDHCVSVFPLHREDVLNRNFTHLMSTLCFLTLSLFIHGPMPPVRRGFRERDSLSALDWQFELFLRPQTSY